MTEGASQPPNPDFNPQNNNLPVPPNLEVQRVLPGDVPTQLTDEEAVLAAARRVVDDAWKGGGTPLSSPEFTPEEAVVAATEAAGHDAALQILGEGLKAAGAQAGQDSSRARELGALGAWRQDARRRAATERFSQPRAGGLRRLNGFVKGERRDPPSTQPEAPQDESPNQQD